MVAVNVVGIVAAIAEYRKVREHVAGHKTDLLRKADASVRLAACWWTFSPEEASRRFLSPIGDFPGTPDVLLVRNYGLIDVAPLSSQRATLYSSQFFPNRQKELGETRRLNRLYYRPRHSVPASSLQQI